MHTRQLKDEGNGITRDSLAFYRDNRHNLGDLAEVSIRFPGYDDPHDLYLMVLRDRDRDRDGAELLLSGCTTGYIGEGPNGAMKLLIDEGCPVDKALIALGAATVHFTRDIDGRWAVDRCLAAAHRSQTPTDIDPAQPEQVRRQGIAHIAP